MKKTIFSTIIGMLFMVVVIGWVYLPDSAFYIHKSTDPSIYTKIGSVWAWLSCLIMGICVFFSGLRLGNSLFDWIKNDKK